MSSFKEIIFDQRGEILGDFDFSYLGNMKATKNDQKIYENPKTGLVIRATFSCGDVYRFQYPEDEMEYVYAVPNDRREAPFITTDGKCCGIYNRDDCERLKFIFKSEGSKSFTVVDIDADFDDPEFPGIGLSTSKSGEAKMTFEEYQDKNGGPNCTVLKIGETKCYILWKGLFYLSMDPEELKMLDNLLS